MGGGDKEQELKLMKKKFIYKIKKNHSTSPYKSPKDILESNLHSEESAQPLNPSLLVQNKFEENQIKYVPHPKRWWLLATVILLNIANYSHWVAFPAVSKMVAQYYDQDGDRMDLIPTVSYGLGIPCCLLATLVVDKAGLRIGLHIGGIFTGLGGLLCFLSSLPYLSDDISNDGKFLMALVGQALTGIACPFISCVPTKVSQHWFSDEQRTLATTLIGMSNPLGIVLGQGITPLIVTRPENVPVMNIVWFIPAAIGALLTMWKVTSNLPPSPPSPSAAIQHINQKSYLSSIKKLFTNPAYVIMFMFVGGAMGYVSTISTKIEQIMCSRGYTDQLSGLSGSLILLVGFLSSFPCVVLAYKTGKIVLIGKISGFLSILTMVLIAYFMRLPDRGVAIVISCILLGACSLGCYPLALEAIVECTYPVDQAIATAFIFFSSAIQGVFLMQMEHILGKPLTPEEMEIQSCVMEGDHGHQQPKDYSNYLYFITAYMSFFIIIFIIFFKTDMKRTKADEAGKTSAISSPNVLSGNVEEGAVFTDNKDLESIQTNDTNSSFEGKQRGP